MHKKEKNVFFFGLVLFLVCVQCSVASAAGRKRKKQGEWKAAYPARYVSLGDLLEHSFYLPDGKTRVDSHVLLPQMILSEVVQVTPKLRVQMREFHEKKQDLQPMLELSSALSNPVFNRFVLVGGITAFEAENTALGVRFGYRQGLGDVISGQLPEVKGSVEFKVGVLRMDFYIQDTMRANEVVAAGTGDYILKKGELKVGLDFRKINSGFDLIFQSPLSKAFRETVQEAILNLVENPRTNFLMDWTVPVSKVHAIFKKIFFEAGQRDEIRVGDLFTIYDANEMRIGEVKVDHVSLDQSSAAYIDDPQSKLIRKTKAGNSLKIYFKRAP